MRSSSSRNYRLLFVLLIALIPALLSPKPAWALRITDDLWWCDGTYTFIVGECYNNPCTGENWCWGYQTPYHTQDTEFCVPVQ